MNRCRLLASSARNSPISIASVSPIEDVSLNQGDLLTQEVVRSNLAEMNTQFQKRPRKKPLKPGLCDSCFSTMSAVWYKNKTQCNTCYGKSYKEAHKEEIAASGKVYYQAHKEKIATRTQARFQAHKEEVIAERKAYKAAHKEEIAAKMKAYKAAHKEEIAAKMKVYYQAHKEEIAAKMKAYRATHKEEIAAKMKAYLEKKKLATFLESINWEDDDNGAIETGQRGIGEVKIKS